MHADEPAGPQEQTARPEPVPAEDDAVREAGGQETLVGFEEPDFGWFVIDSVVITGATWGLTMAFNENIREGVMNSSGQQWLDNISQAPQWHDGSDALTNYVAHPLLGGLEFLAYRSRGHGIVASSVGVVFQVLMLEYLIEGPHNVPSAKDLLITPLVGIPLGYGLDTLSVYLLKKEGKRVRYLGYLFNPFYLLPTSKYRWRVSVDPVNKSLAFSFVF